MKITLTPVIEISNIDQDIQCPDFGPFWKYEDDWENYNCVCNSKAGFPNTMKPYLKGSSLYRVNKISDDDLLKAIRKE